jgi:ClpP class serine protease
MKTIFHALEEKILQQFIETKKELLEIASGMTAKERQEGRVEIMEAAVLYDIPEDMESARDLYTIDDEGSAIIPIQGKLTPQADICDGFFSDCTTYRFIQQATLAADDDPLVREIKFHVSSGGGYVEGVDATGQVIAGCKKKTTAMVSGMAASAAYWIASQADSIILSAPTDFVGSIGVAVEIIDTRKREEAAGIKRIVLTSTDAPDKRIDLATEEGQGKMIDELDAIHGVFVARVAGGRNVTKEKINRDFGQGGIVIASQAKKAGMVDAVINEISTNPISKQSVESVNHDGDDKTPAAAGKPKQEASIMNLTELLAANPEAKAEHENLIAAARSEGETAGKEAGREERGEEMKAAFTAAQPILSSTEYPDHIKERVSEKAMVGDTEGLKDFVAIHDMNLENKKGEEAKGEQGDETPPSGPVSDDEKAKAEFQDKKSRVAGLV